MKFDKGERFAIKGNTIKGGVRFGLLSSSGGVIQEVTLSDGPFNLSVEAPETGEYTPMIRASLPEKNRPIEFTVTEISHP